MSKKTFPTSDLLSVIVGFRVSPSMNSVRDLLVHIHGSEILDDRATQWLIQQHPWLWKMRIPKDAKSEAAIAAWVASVSARYGNRHSVAAMPGNKR